MYFSKVFQNELEDRIDARYYGPKYVENLRLLKNKASNNCKFKTLDEISSKIVTSAFYEAIASEYSDTGIPFLRVSDVKEMAIDNSNLVHLPETIANKTKTISKAKSGTIVISKGGTIGNVAVISPSMPKCCLSRDIIGVTIKPEEAKSGYIGAFLTTKYGKLQFERIKTQQIQPHLTLDVIRKLKIVIPKIEQEYISGLVESAEANEVQAINKIEQARKIFSQAMDISIEKIADRKKYRILSNELCNIFTPIYYYPKYVELIQKIKSKHDTCLLGKIADIKKGNEVGSHNYSKNYDARTEDIPFIRTSDIVNYEIDTHPDFFVPKNIYSQLNQQLKTEDILFTNDGKIGQSAMLIEGNKCIIQSHIRKIHVNETLSPYYVFTFLTTKFALWQVSRNIIIQATIPTIGNSLADLEIPILPDDLQKEIVTLTKDAFDKKAKKLLLLKKTKETIEAIIEEKTSN